MAFFIKSKTLVRLFSFIIQSQALAVFLFILFHSSSVFAQLSCIAFLDESDARVKSSVHSEHFEPITTNFSSASTRRTVEISGSLEGRHGGRRIVLTKSGKQWLSQYITFHFDVQGDPRWFIGASGEEVAKFFGFEIINHREMTIPDAVEFQGAIDRVNQQLIANGKEPINLNFVADDLVQAPLLGYLNQFAQFNLPIATRGNHLVHDMSFHSGAIYTPPRLIEAANKRVRFVMSFLDYLDQKVGPRSQPSFKRIKKLVKSFLVRGIDNGTGFGNLVLIAQNSNNQDVANQILALMSAQNDLPYNKFQLPVIPTSHLVFGSIVNDTFYNDKSIVYHMPSSKNKEFTLEDFTHNLLWQYFTLLPDFAKLDSDLDGIWMFLRDNMNLFKLTPEGWDYDLDLAAIFSPHHNYNIGPRSVTLGEQDTINLLIEYKLRARDIQRAVRFLNQN